MGVGPVAPPARLYPAAARSPGVPQNPDDLTRWHAEVYSAVAAEAERCGAEIHWLEETGVRTDHNPGTGYSPCGTTPTARVNGRPARVNAVSALTNAGVVRLSVSVDRFRASVFIGFLSRLLRGPPGTVFLVLDGHPVHRRRRIRDWVGAQGGRVRLFFLPPYCPELNPTEYLNNAVKGGVPRFRRPRDQVQLAERVGLWLRVIQRRPHVALRFFQAEPVRDAA